MFVAQAFDAGSGQEPYFSPDRPRLVDPELRHRAVGYLGLAPEAAPGHRSDGVWVWPDVLAQHARCGVGPQVELLDHLELRAFEVPDEVPVDLLGTAARAASGPSTPVPARQPATYLAGPPAMPGEPPRVWRRRRGAGVGLEAFGRHGWWVAPAGAGQPGPDLVEISEDLVEISERRASGLVDLLTAWWYEQSLDGGEPGPAPRVARVFDAETAAGTPYFSPGRLRIIEPGRRARLAGYLSGGRLVVRATGGARDPLDPANPRPVPLNSRTDGVWVWQEALAHYVVTRGVAPELPLLCHIEERGYRLPRTVPGDALGAAADAARRGRPVQTRPTPEARVHRALRPMTYHRAAGPAAGPDDSAAVLLLRAPAGDLSQAEALTGDLRWRPAAPPRCGWLSLVEIGAEQAAGIIDACWAHSCAAPS